MKNLTFFFCAVLFSFGINLNASAQGSAGDILVGGGPGYGTEIKSLAVQAGGAYRINEEFRAAADLIYYFSGEDVRGLDFNWLEFNVNGHYFYVDKEDIVAYALAGFNFASLTSDHPDVELPSGDSTDKVYVGLNIGTGVEFPVGALNLYVEGKYALSSAHQLALTAGVRVPVGNR